VQAVAEGHVKGIVHRDIKPGNLFLTTRADGTPLIKVLDFGIAKTLESDAAESTSLTSSDDVRLGSPAYMPPEQLQNPRDVDKRSDIWSLGATLYELLCGRPPFEGPGYLELASRILSQPPIPLSNQRVPAPLPDGLERVLGKCLEKDRTLRYANAAELATALAPFGSADARMSLSRVSGMLGSQSSIPALTRALPVDPASCTATLEVPTDPVASPDHRRTSNIGAVASTPAPAPRRSWFILAAAAVAVAAVVALRPQPSTAPAAGVTPSKSPVAAAAAVLPAPRVLPPGVEASSGAVAALPVLPRPEVTPAEHVATPSAVAAPHRAAPTHAVERVSLVSAPVSVSDAAPATTEPARVAAPPVASEPAPNAGLGRSAEIERLIEQRR
jgi:serine/threonine-protein kinase